MAASVFVLLSLVAVTAGYWGDLPQAQPVGEPRFCSSEGQLCFSYNRRSVIGPPRWFNVCQTRKCFFGENQSPVYINPFRVEYGCGRTLGYYENPTIIGSLRNEGIYPQVNDIEQKANLTGVPGYEGKTFELSAVHIHFRGGRDNRGTEHQVGFADYDAETRHGRRSTELDRILHNVGGVLEYRLNLCRKFFKRCPCRIYGKDYFKKFYGEDNGNGNEYENNNGNGNVNGYDNGHDNGDDNGEYEDDDDDDFYDCCRKFLSKPLRCRGDGDNGNGYDNDNRNGNGNGSGSDNGNGNGSGSDNGNGNGSGSDNGNGNGSGSDNGNGNGNGNRNGNGNNNGYNNGYYNGYNNVSENGNGDNGDNGYEGCDDDDDDNGECPDNAEPRCLDDKCGEIKIEFRPDGLLPKRRDFFYYYGSTTSPPVTETVAWNIMAEPVRITRYQLKMMQMMESRRHGVRIVANGNVRPLQSLNGRKVYGNFCSLLG